MAQKITVNGSTSYPFEQTNDRVHLTRGMHTALIADDYSELFIGDGYDVVPDPNEIKLAELGDCPSRPAKIVYADIWSEMVDNFKMATTSQDIIDVCSYYAAWHYEHGDDEFAAVLEAVAESETSAAKFRKEFLKHYAA